ncbi:MAG TPA: TIGR03790 family protein [Prosthecobacter sp.]|nr:TIGR03790 family protein [Prosthecobacter sp.]
MKRVVAILSLLAVAVLAQAERFDLPAETVVVYNPEFPQSRELAEFYAQRRGIKADHVIGLKCPMEDSMSRQEYDSLLRKPLVETFVRRGWWRMNPQSGRGVESSSVRVVALIRGIPFQIRRDTQNPQSKKEDEASVDSELALLGMPSHTIEGAVRNPYYEQPMRFQMFQGAPGLLLIGRLDGPDSATVRRIIDDAILAEQTGLRGRAVIDLALKSGAYEEGEKWLRESARLFRSHGLPVYVDEDEPLIPDHWPLPDTALYFGWYATNASGAVNSPSFKFQPGAVACHLHSFSASALRSPDRQWVGPLLRKGAAAVMGNAFEPYLSLTVHFDTFNKRLLEGYTLAEAAWNATPVLSWMSVVVGDPLYRPFAQGARSSLGEARDRDYAVYRGNAVRFAGEDSTIKLKAALAESAAARANPHLLELTALLSAGEGKISEALGLLEHAESLYAENADKLRVILYQAECHRRGGQNAAAKARLERVLVDPAHDGDPALQAARTMLKELP